MYIEKIVGKIKDYIKEYPIIKGKITNVGYRRIDVETIIFYKDLNPLSEKESINLFNEFKGEKEAKILLRFLFKILEGKRLLISESAEEFYVNLKRD